MKKINFFKLFIVFVTPWFGLSAAKGKGATVKPKKAVVSVDYSKMTKKEQEAEFLKVTKESRRKVFVLTKTFTGVISKLNNVDKKTALKFKKTGKRVQMLENIIDKATNAKGSIKPSDVTIKLTKDYSKMSAKEQIAAYDKVGIEFGFTMIKVLDEYIAKLEKLKKVNTTLKVLGAKKIKGIIAKAVKANHGTPAKSKPAKGKKVKRNKKK